MQMPTSDDKKGVGMLDESRTAALNARVRPSIKSAIEADRRAKGQSLAEWMERLLCDALGMKDEKVNNSGE